MDGAQFLAKVRDLSPTIVRLALTGYADIDTAMAAVNENNIFRFLTKPCSKENLLKAIEAALAQHHLLNAEKDFLEQTLRVSVSVLTEVLSFSNSGEPLSEQWATWRRWQFGGQNLIGNEMSPCGDLCPGEGGGGWAIAGVHLFLAGLRGVGAGGVRELASYGCLTGVLRL